MDFVNVCRYAIQNDDTVQPDAPRRWTNLAKMITARAAPAATADGDMTMGSCDDDDSTVGLCTAHSFAIENANTQDGNDTNGAATGDVPAVTIKVETTELDTPHTPATPVGLTVLSNPETGERLFFDSFGEATEHLNVSNHAAATVREGGHRSKNNNGYLIVDPTKKELNELMCAVTLYDAAIGHRRVFPTVVSAAKFVGVPVQAFVNASRAGDTAINGWRRVFDSGLGGPASTVRSGPRLTVLHTPGTNERLFFESMILAAEHLGIGRAQVATARYNGALVNGRLVVDATKKELDGISRVGGVVVTKRARKCGVCRRPGHNRTSCPDNSTP